jgi:hypothetical protein
MKRPHIRSAAVHPIIQAMAMRSIHQQPADRDVGQVVRGELHLDLADLRAGRLQLEGWGRLRLSICVSLVLARDHGIGEEYQHVAESAIAALLCLRDRAKAAGKYLPTEMEVNALCHAGDLIEAQLPLATAGDMSAAVQRVKHAARVGGRL